MYRGFPNQAEFPQRPVGFGPPPIRVPQNGAHFGSGFGPGAEAPPRFPPSACGPYPTPGSDGNFTPGPVRDHYLNTPVRCSGFPVDRSTCTTLGDPLPIPPHSAQQHPMWGTSTLEAPPKDNSERAAGEEFLRCIAANKPLPEYLKGNMAHNLADALKSANTVGKAEVVSDSESRSRSRSRSRNRAKRAKSHARSKSRVRSKSRARSRSHGKSRAWSKSRPRSRTRGKSQGRHKSRAGSTSRGRSRARSRSWSPRSRSRIPPRSLAQEPWTKSSPSGSCSATGSTGANALIQGLKCVMNSKELENRLPSLKDAILTIRQASNQGQDTKVDCVPNKSHPRFSSHQHEDQVTRERDSMLLPHERVGNDFFWLQSSGPELSNDRPTDDIEDEESFLYGDVPEKQSAAHISQTRQLAINQYVPSRSSPMVSQQQHQQNPMFKNLEELFNLKPTPQVDSQSSAAAAVEPEPTSRQEPSSCTPDRKDCEKLQGVLKNMGLNLGTTDISKLFVNMEEKEHSPARIPEPASEQTPPVFPALGNTNARQALETLQSLIKATKEKRTKGDVATVSQPSSDQHKVINQANGNEEARRREKQTRIKKIESLMKDLEGLLQEDGNSCLTPVIGFYCKKCEEFIGDVNTAESHIASHSRKDSNSPPHRVDGSPAGNDPWRPGHTTTTSSSRDRPSRHPYHQHHHPAADGRDPRGPSHRRDPGGTQRGPHQDFHGDYVHSDGKHGPNPQELPEKRFLKEEMAKERLLITVARGQTPPPKMRPDKETDPKSQAVAKPGRGQPEPEDSGNALKPAKDSSSSSSSSSEDDEKDRLAKIKTLKKKKKEKKKEKKKKKKKKKEKKEKGNK